MSLAHLRHPVWSLCLLGMLGLPLGCRVQAPAAVHGSVYVFGRTGSTDDVNITGRQIFLPDIEVFLHNVSSGTDSPPDTTDLYGRYQFPQQAPGTYELRWNAQRGWAAGVHPEKILINGFTQYPKPAELRVEGDRGMVFGQVSLAGGDASWAYDELFTTNLAPTITLLNVARTVTVAGPIHANAEGYYAIAGAQRSQGGTIRAQSEVVTATRVVAAANVSVGNAVAPVDVELPNHRPQLVALVPEVGGMTVRTAATGTTIQVRAVANDPDNDALSYDWKLLAGSGTLAPAGSATQWTLPANEGRYTVYVQVKDGRGGYVHERLIFHVGKKDDLFSGRVVDQSATAVAGARVSINGTIGTTDGNGFFSIRAPLSPRYVLNITKRGFALFSRVAKVEIIGQTWTLVKTQEETVDPTQPIVLVDHRPELDRQRLRGVRITVPANSLVDSAGRAPSGPLTAYLATLNIAAGQAPGDWGARTGIKESNLISYGAAFVEFLDAAGTKFNLKPGATAGVDMATAASLLPGAPPNTQLWSYDESDGYWKVSGTAALNGGTGVFSGKVSHFSTINTDLSKTDAACLKALIYPPLSTGSKLRVTDPTGAVFGQSFDLVLDAAINAVYRLPANTNVKLELFDPQGNAITSLLVEEVPGTPLANNIINTGPAIPPGGNLWPDPPYDDCKLAVLRLDVQATPSIFLTFKDVGSAPQAAGYYATVDPNSLRTTLGAWWSTNGFTVGADGFPNNAVRTSYLNNNDLGSGRDMYFLQHPDGTMAAYVTNYGLFDQNPDNAQLAADRTVPGATVAMEYSPVEGQGTTRIVKFFVFAGNGNGAAAARQAGAELDGFGVKFVPNLCLNCHGGSFSPANVAAPTFAEVNMQAAFRELDIATYKFPAGRLTANAAEKDAFKQQNLIVKGLNAGDALTRQAIKDLIAGWYAGGTSDQDNTFTPSGWAGAPQQGLYQDVVKTSCRTCHIAFVSSENAGGLNWNRYDQLSARHDFLKSFVLCEDRYMPHAVITYRNFWLSGSPHRPGALRDFVDGSNWSKLGICQ